MCMIDGADYDSQGFSNTRWRKAGKNHQCCECRRIIHKGERHEVTNNLYEGSFNRWRMCEHCAAAASWLSVACNGYLFQGVLEDLQEHWENEYQLQSLHLGRLIVGMRRGWVKIRGGLLPVPREWTAVDLPFAFRQNYHKRTTAYSGAFKADDGQTLFTEHAYLLDGFDA